MTEISGNKQTQLESKWLSAADPDWLLDNIGDASSPRKLRLFACACCRDIWHLLTDERSRNSVEVSERFADGMATRKELDAARDAAWDAMRAAAWDAAWDEKCKHFAVLFRDVFGNPFRPVAIDPRWLTSNVVDLASIIYEERAYDRLPYLGDALMDAGCDIDDIIQHCRGEGPHVRGCWVVDLLLGKA